MKKLVAIFCFGFLALNVNADERYAHEYSTDNDDEHHDRKHKYDDWRDSEREEWLESEERERRSFQTPRYQQNYQQQPSYQIYLSPNQNYLPRDKQTRDDNRWRQRREELQQMPQTPYYENQFNRDDTHW